MADIINVVNRGVFNAPGQLFNSDEPIQGGPQRYLRALPDEQGSAVPVAPRPKRFTTLDGKQPAEIAEADAPILSVPVVGCLAAVRAARITHQHREKVWGPDSMVGLVAQTSAADPTPAQLDQMYSDLELFSYLPAQMRPTRAEFEDLARPQRRATVVQTSLAKAGVVISREPVQRPVLDDPTSDEALLPAQVPFSETALDSCRG
jgi:hypothetical protein